MAVSVSGARPDAWGARKIFGVPMPSLWLGAAYPMAAGSGQILPVANILFVSESK